MAYPKRRQRRRRHRCPPRMPRALPVFTFVLAPVPIPPPQPLAQVRQNYHRDCEIAVNNLIQLQLYASYVYLSMAFYCDRCDVALKNFSRFFLRRSHQWTEDTEKLLWLQNERGGRFNLRRINKPDRDDWHSGLQAMECSFYLEMTISESFVELYQLAISKNDPHLYNYVKRHCLRPQLENVKKVANYLSELRRKRDGMNEYLFDRNVLGKMDED
ncbi:ferritin heavy chain-like [Perognathus longimembris pacificus]|uniref:ferritin heavy chain-like n=1 Tax=Perognathus longimembris pacificus TaxID=214514 RepID=UPI002018DB6B|nr:ferritin heavy chain-like [Perognathus longimembris pacificus]